MLPVCTGLCHDFFKAVQREVPHIRTDNASTASASPKSQTRIEYTALLGDGLENWFVFVHASRSAAFQGAPSVPAKVVLVASLIFNDQVDWERLSHKYVLHVVRKDPRRGGEKTAHCCGLNPYEYYTGTSIVKLNHFGVRGRN
jgi:hypothetical protein